MSEALNTRMEDASDLRQWIEASEDGRRQPEPGSTTQSFRPTHRPSMATLCVLDDDQKSGSWSRLMQPETVIGRDGDICVAHDPAISRRHFKISRTETRHGGYRWLLEDLGGENGTFVQVESAEISCGQRFLVGSHCLAIRGTIDVGGCCDASSARKAATQALNVKRGFELRMAGSTDAPIALIPDEFEIGRTSGQCRATTIADDQFISPSHAGIRRQGEKWHLSDYGSLNGTWVEIKRLAVTGSIRIQAGEQRFVLRVV